MKILYRYILKEHIGPFIFGLSVITFILIMDFLLEILDLIISKGLNAFVILKVFALNLAWILALSIPMAVLIAVLMAFGRLSADNEITALKATGTSLYKIVYPILWSAGFLGVLMVGFNNYVLPEANHRARILMSDIHQKRPTLNLKENTFLDDIPGYHILIKKIGKKSSDIYGVTIYEQKESLFPRTIIAEKGKIEFSPDGNTLILHLYQGEVHQIDEQEPSHYRRVTFDKQTLYITDIQPHLGVGLEEFRTDREMTIGMMKKETERLKAELEAKKKSIQGLTSRIFDKILKENPEIRNGSSAPEIDEKQALLLAWQKNSQILTQLQTETLLAADLDKKIDGYWVEIHKKYSIPVACLVFVLVGAPLGVMGKKKGVAVGAGLSLGFFLLYWAFLIAGEELADRQFITPFWAMWSANIILGIVGIFLLYQTSKEAKFIPWEKLIRFIPSKLREKFKWI